MAKNSLMNLLARRWVDWTLLLILVLAAFFRFFNFKELQYLSLDEEMVVATVRHIVESGKPVLLVQNVAVEFGLGPFYHWLLTPFFFITNFNLVLLYALPSALGVVTTFLVYKSGEMIGGKKLGYLAGFVYATSFFISLFERRLVHLTLDPFMCALAFFGLVKLVKKEYVYMPIVAIPVGFTFHADPSLAVLTIAIFAAWVIFKFPLRNRNVIYFLLVLGIFFVPFIASEIRHKGVVSNALVHSFSRPFRGVDVTPIKFFYYQPDDFVKVLSRIIFTPPSNFIESQFEYTREYEGPLFSPLTQLFVVLLLFLHLRILFKNKSKEHKFVLLQWVLFSSFIFGILVFNRVFKGGFYQHYFMIIFPVVILMFTYVISSWRKTWIFLFATLYFLVNVYSLVNSTVKYPLYQKIELVGESLKSIGNNKFSIYASEWTWVQSAGWTELYTLQKHPAVKSFSYEYLDWIYRAYSLYPVATQKEDPERIVWIAREDEPLDKQLPIIASYNLKDIKLYVLDNSLAGSGR